jgi:hypothetical protein
MFKEDTTNYGPILDALSSLDGGPSQFLEPAKQPPKANLPGQSKYKPMPGESMENFMKRMGIAGGKRKTKLRTRKNRKNKSRKFLRK